MSVEVVNEVVSEVITKVCSKCGVDKSVLLFYKHPKGKLGVMSSCIDCIKIYDKNRRPKTADEKERRKIYSKDYRETNKEIIKAKNKEKYELNRTTILENKKNYYNENKALILQKAANNYILNREDKLEAVKNYNVTNKSKRRKTIHKRRANILEAVGCFTQSDIKNILIEQKCKCLYCDSDITDSYQVDHIFPISKYKYNGPENLQMLCSKCNNVKHAKDPIKHEKSIGVLSPTREIFLEELREFIISATLNKAA